jgi:hypothetical protein
VRQELDLVTERAPGAHTQNPASRLDLLRGHAEEHRTCATGDDQGLAALVDLHGRPVFREHLDRFAGVAVGKLLQVAFDVVFRYPEAAKFRALDLRIEGQPRPR